MREQIEGSKAVAKAIAACAPLTSVRDPMRCAACTTIAVTAGLMP